MSGIEGFVKEGVTPDYTKNPKKKPFFDEKDIPCRLPKHLDGEVFPSREGIQMKQFGIPQDISKDISKFYTRDIEPRYAEELHSFDSHEIPDKLPAELESGIKANCEGKGMTKEERGEAYETSPYSKDITDAVYSKEELEYYIKNGYKEVEIGDKKVLVPGNLDLDLKDADGKTNLERMKEGKAPIGPDGKPYNLHHIGQNKDGPLAIIPDGDHKSMDSVLHDKSKPTEIDRREFQKEKKEIYKGLAEKLEAPGEE